MAFRLQQILTKLGIAELNSMQEEARLAITHGRDVRLLSPTGSGKTLAFLLPLLEVVDTSVSAVQVLVVAPSRELAIQIESVARSMATGLKVNVVYGGRPIKKDFADLASTPSVLIGTPGRLGDHLRRGTVDGATVQSLVIDEYDKSLELGFDDEMSELYNYLPHLQRRVLTSATDGVDIPYWLSDFSPLEVDHLSDAAGQLELRRVISPDKDKLHRLVELLGHLSGQRGIIFLNYKDSIHRTSEYLDDFDIPHGCFYGGLDQHERERALIQFRNGSTNILLATDLAARGIDVPELDFIIHYHLPLRAEEFTHRNGRTARMHADGTAYILQWAQEDLPDYVPACDELPVDLSGEVVQPQWATIFVSGGRRDRISKGDIAGFCMKVGGLDKGELGLITLKQDCAFVAVAKHRAKKVIPALDNQRLKKRKVRVYGL